MLVILNQSFDTLNEAVNWGTAHATAGKVDIFCIQITIPSFHHLWKSGVYKRLYKHYISWVNISSNKCWHEHIENKGNTVSFESDVEKDEERGNLDNLYLERNANYKIYSYGDNFQY